MKLYNMNMSYDEMLQKYLSDPKRKKEYNKSKVEFEIALIISENRRKNNLTQQELANLTGMDRSDISKIENCDANPTIDTLKRLADALGKKLEIRFI